MSLDPPRSFSRPVRNTLRWLVPAEAVANPRSAIGEDRYILRNAERLHESLNHLPAAGGSGRCLVVGSWGLETPYLCEKLGWREITCVATAAHPGMRRQRRSRIQPATGAEYEYDYLEHDIESEPLPFETGHFDMVIFWGCLEHLRSDPEFGLYELNRVATPGATLSLVTDNAISFRATCGLLRGEPVPMRLNWPSKEGHSRKYSPREVEDLLIGTGWRVDSLQSIVSDPPAYGTWWKRWRLRRWVAGQRLGLAEPYWNAYLLAMATRASAPTRSYPSWLYKDEKIRQLKVEMLELVSREVPKTLSA